MSNDRPPESLPDLRARTEHGIDHWYTADGTWAVLRADALDGLIRAAGEAGPGLGPQLGLNLAGPMDLPPEDERTEEAVPTNPRVLVSAAGGTLTGATHADAAPTVLQKVVISPSRTPSPSGSGVRTGFMLFATLVVALCVGLYVGDSNARQQLDAARPGDAEEQTRALQDAPTVPDAAPATPRDADAEQGLADSPSPRAAPSDATPDADAPEQVAPEAAPEPATTPEPAAASAVPTPAPAAPTARKTSPKPPSASSLTRKAWSVVERDPADAALLFQQALAAGANSAEANYGYGYAQLRLGDKGQAATYLCRARSGGRDTQREVEGLLRTHKLSCD